jgi:U32 family peptidase
LKFTPELLSPAGSFDAAIAAFEGGADAVYLGLKDHSARKAAKNFSIDELLRLKTVANEHQKKIYVTLNTVIKESEFQEVLLTASFLNEIEIDAIIIQDLGLFSAIKELFPSIPIHASTQMAAHTKEGVDFLKQIGFSRVVLSREMPLSKIIEIRREVPDIELEVFIHGALCYSFSGLCLASGMLLGRSGNRGECAQICRNYFEEENGNTYPFSCNDLALTDKVLHLAKAGIDCFKIEGRMKSPHYVYNTASLYRTILDGKEHSKAHEKSRISFSRKETHGCFSSFSGTDVTDSIFPGHRGLPIGKCEKVSKGMFLMKISEPVGLRDGILFFRNNNEKYPSNCSVRNIFTAAGKEIGVGKPGEMLFIKSDQLPEPGDIIYLTSSSSLERKKTNPLSIKPWKKAIDIEVTCREVSISLSSGNFTFENKPDIQPSENPSGFIEKLTNILSSSGDSLYTAGKISFDRTCENIFISPAILKNIKNSFYKEYLEHFKQETDLKISSFYKKAVPSQKKISAIFSKRELFNPLPDIPFIMENDDLSKLPLIENFSVLPLVPVMKNSHIYLQNIEKLILESPEKNYLAGISNVGHFPFAQTVSKHSNVSFFIDFHLYLANKAAWDLFRNILGKKLLFGYKWIENMNRDELPENTGLISCDETFKPPLFISTLCLLKQSGKECSSCDRKITIKEFSNSGRKFRAVTVDCTTLLYG